MKVSIINSVFNKNLPKQSIKSNPIKNNSTNLSTLNLNETLGRAQVGFTSLFKSTPSGYEYENDGSEKINYNKKIGSFFYGNCEKTVVFDPTTGIETTTTIRKDGVEIITDSKQEQTRKITDKQGKILYFYKKDNTTGDYQECSTDTNLQRVIFTTMQNGIKKSKVLDLTSKNFVTQGKLTWVDEVDKENNMVVTKNVVTNAIIKERSTNPNNPFARKYDEEKGCLTFETYFDKKTGLHVAKRYYESGIASFVQTYTKDGSFTEIKRYDEENKETDHIAIITEGKIKTTQVFYPNTSKTYYTRQDYINKKTGKTEYAIKEYKRFPNVAQSEKTYIFDSNSLTREVLFLEDGKHPAMIISYDKDGSRTEETYGKDTYLKTIERFNSDNFMTSHLEYVTETGFIKSSTKLYKAIDYDPETGKQQEYYYDDSGNFYSTHYVTDKNGNLLEKARYYPNSNNIHILYEYYNGVCTETTKDKNGNIINIEQYPTTEGYKEEESKTDEELASKYRAIPLNSVTKKGEYGVSDTNESAIKKAADIINNNGNIFQITDEEWQVVLKELGLKNINELDSLTNSSYRKIHKTIVSKAEGGNADKYKNLLTILNFFHKG